MKLALNLPINRVSFGQVSTLLLKTIYEQEKNGQDKHDIYLFPIGPVDLGAQQPDQQFGEWLKQKMINGLENYNRGIPIFKLWHLNDSLGSLGQKQTLLTFYELDAPTKVELNIAANNKVLFSSLYAQEVFKKSGIDAGFIPLAFDSFNFKPTKRRIPQDRIVMNLCGKFEKRKHHDKIIKAWIKKYGNNRNYALQCAIFNPFFNEEQNRGVIHNAVNGNKPFNVNFFPMMNENTIYNDFLNNCDIIIGMSGGEGFGLPEFQSIALGKHAILMDAHSYPSWASKDMATWVKPSGKIPVYDGVFFTQGQPFNQGNIFDFNEEEFLYACDTAIAKATANPVNTSGLALQIKFSKEIFLENVMKSIE